MTWFSSYVMFGSPSVGPSPCCSSFSFTKQREVIFWSFLSQVNCQSRETAVWSASVPCAVEVKVGCLVLSWADNYYIRWGSNRQYTSRNFSQKKKKRKLLGRFIHGMVITAKSIKRKQVRFRKRQIKRVINLCGWRFVPLSVICRVN